MLKTETVNHEMKIILIMSYKVSENKLIECHNHISFVVSTLFEIFSAL